MNKSPSSLPPMTFHEANENRIREGICKVLRKHGALSGDAIARRMDVCRTRVFDRVLKDLVASGQVNRTGERRLTLYSLGS
jgi:predicted ArsR family transcriptional regulator